MKLNPGKSLSPASGHLSRGVARRTSGASRPSRSSTELWRLSEPTSEFSGEETEAQRQKASSPRSHSIWQDQETKSSTRRLGWDWVNFDLRDFMKHGKHQGLWGRDGQGWAGPRTVTPFPPCSLPGQDQEATWGHGAALLLETGKLGEVLGAGVV